MCHSFSGKLQGDDEEGTVVTFEGHSTVALRSRENIVLHQSNLDIPSERANDFCFNKRHGRDTFISHNSSLSSPYFHRNENHHRGEHENSHPHEYKVHKGSHAVTHFFGPRDDDVQYLPNVELLRGEKGDTGAPGPPGPVGPKGEKVCGEE
ncbi:hypothetical protein AVEN_30193-1 [Araneus ventricosus]|uniref:Uncharacterized protein n=1 Tax=Araneus ventricosus TaxID=182803 RepID=A0A4Y2DRA7_ARAVE|nr:hypothetical protein AVEN_30193-1 [Araneus ventricosus]